MEQKKQEILQRIGELNKVNFFKPTARELHSGNAMLGRVQRQERRRYEEAVKRQKEQLIKQISEIDRYLQSVKDYDIYMASLPIGPMITAPTILSQPNIIIGKKPILVKTRLPRYIQRVKRK